MMIESILTKTVCDLLDIPSLTAFIFILLYCGKPIKPPSVAERDPSPSFCGVDKRSDADATTNYVVDKRSDADSANNYFVDQVDQGSELGERQPFESRSRSQVCIFGSTWERVD